MSNTSRLSRELAIAGLEVPNWPSSFSLGNFDSDWPKQTLAYAKAIRDWRFSLQVLPEHIYKKVVSDFYGVNGEPSLLHWEQMVLDISLLDKKLMTKPRSGDELLDTILRHAKSFTEIAGFAIAETRAGRLAVAAQSVLHLAKNASLPSDVRLSIVGLFVQEINLSWYLQEARFSQSYWNALIKILRLLTRLSDLVLAAISTYCSDDCDRSLAQIFLVLDRIHAVSRGHSEWICLPKSEVESLVKDNCVETALSLLQDNLNGVYPDCLSPALARFFLCKILIGMGRWELAKDVHIEAVDQIVDCKSMLARFEDELVILRSESELISTEVSLALNSGALVDSSAPSPLKTTESRYDIGSLSRSQLGQDLWVLERLNWKTGGYFVEFGATDGVLLSNTWLLEKYFHWDGVCAEPNPTLFAKLKINRNCYTSQACVFRNSGERLKFILADAYGGIADCAHNDSHAPKRDAYLRAGNDIEVVTVSLMDLLDQAGAPPVVDYLSIDTEGSEYAILEGIDWGRYAFRCITVEHNYGEQRSLIRKLLEGIHGYSVIERKFDDWYYKDVD